MAAAEPVESAAVLWLSAAVAACCYLAAPTNSQQHKQQFQSQFVVEMAQVTERNINISPGLSVILQNLLLTDALH